MKYKNDWGPGFRFFRCEECDIQWRDVSRDWTSPSGDPCPHCCEMGLYVGGEPHYEWPTDKFGNLLDDYDYEKEEL